MSLLSRVRFASVAVYATQETTELNLKSKQLILKIKDGDVQLLEQVVARAVVPHAAELADFLNPERILVPTPRSSLLRPGDYWPAQAICKALTDAGFGAEVRPILQRQTAVAKSSRAGRGHRISAHRHYETIGCANELLSGPFTLVDDVVTLGNTFLGAASLVAETYPDTDIKCFALSRTRGFEPDIPAIMNIFPNGEIRRNGDFASRQD